MELDQHEIDAYWDQIAATPWHKRSGLEAHLTPPISRWGRAIYYVTMPVVVLTMLASSLALFLIR